jgi:formylglycine-generating enzyme required for sulfatase activity
MITLPFPPLVRNSGRVLLPLALLTSAYCQALPHLFESNGTGSPNKLVWKAEPGIRYDLWQSANLADWSRVTGYPAVATGLAMEHAFTAGPRGFFKMVPLDEQPPVVVDQFPGADGFAVSRFADLSVRLADATGIDPASVRLTVGATGPLAPGAPGLAFVGDTVTYDPGPAPLGAWGATVTATLVAADTLGRPLTHTWSFRLEPEPQLAADVFVFGSPIAQRSGQRVSGPAAALAARYPAPEEPAPVPEPLPWHIESVLADRIVIAYEVGGVPAFTVGQLICNLVPTKASEIFYRRVLAITDDASDRQLTLMTTAADLTEFVIQGAVSVTADSVLFELDAAGNFVRSSAANRTLNFPRTGVDLSGSSLKLRAGGGYEVTLTGLGTQSSGGGATWLEVSLPEYSWGLTPQVRAGLELDAGGMKSFEAVASGQVALATRFDAEALGVGAATKTTLYDLPENPDARQVALLGVIPAVVPPFGIPVFATLGFDFSMASQAEAPGPLKMNATYRQQADIDFGLSDRREAGLDWIHRLPASSPELGGDAGLTGEFSLGLTLEPRLEFLVCGLAGFETALAPATWIAATAASGGGFSGSVGADFGCLLGAVGPAFEAKGYEAQLGLTIWHGEWPLAPQALAFKTQPETCAVPPGTAVTFTCAVDSPSPPTFQWYHDGTAIPGETARELVLPQVTSGHAGTYQVRATAAGLAVDSDAATLRVETAPTGMVLIPAGPFVMGDPSTPVVGAAAELPAHSVQVSAFYLAKYEVTKALWDEVRSWGASHGYLDLPVGEGKAANHPVHSIDWYELVKWCNARSEKEGLLPCYKVSGAVYRTGVSTPTCDWSANGYRLPCEAEWEKAARGGPAGLHFPWGNAISHSSANFWNAGGESYQSGSAGAHPTFATGGDPYTSPVGSFAPNGFGLYDMAGTVREWCWDWWGDYAEASQTDPRGPSTGYFRAIRGGAWYNFGAGSRCACRPVVWPTDADNTNGFRVARSRP